MKKLLMILSLISLLCFSFSCQDKAAMEELETLKIQAKVEAKNKELVKKMFEAWGKGDFETFGGLLAPGYVFYYPSGTTKPLSFENLREMAKMSWNGFPDLSFSIEEIFAVGDKVVFRFIQRGTHKGDFMGIPATGNKIECSGILITRIENEKIVEQWEAFDMLGMMQQLGMELKPKEGEK
jgi:steroid delta-isomerase-like uncharacterized protein